MTRACINCEYEAGADCHFPEPQKGGAAPWMIQAACVDRRNGGAGCLQFREAAKPPSKEPKP